MSKKKVILIIVSILIVAAGIILGVSLSMNSGKAKEKDVNIDLGNGLEVIAIGSYSGEFVEDGSNEEVKDVLMIKVTNTSETVLQYTEIALKSKDDVEARFTLSTLPPNETVMVLEADKKSYDKKDEYISGEAKDVVFFHNGISLYQDKLEIGGLEGAFNVKNISDKDINGDIYIYYKNYKDGLFYGGITYRAKIEGGIKTGEMKQVMTKHYSPDTCMLMFVTMGE